jgi:hypothetical protein
MSIGITKIIAGYQNGFGMPKYRIIYDNKVFLIVFLL